MSKIKKAPVSLLIPCKNEENNIARCIQSVQWVDEIFVVDSQSTDKTIEIAESLGAEVVQFKYKGCLLYTSPSPRDQRGSRMPSSA